MEIQPIHILQMRRGISEARIVLDSRFSRAIIPVYLLFIKNSKADVVGEDEDDYRIGVGGMSAAQLGRCASDAERMAFLCLGAGGPPPEVYTDREITAAMLDAVLQHLESLLTSIKAHNKDRLDSFGPQPEARSVEELFDALKVTPDVDGMKYLIDVAQRNMHREMIMRDDYVLKKLKELVDTMVGFRNDKD